MNAYVPREIEFKSGELSLKGYLFVPSDDGPHPCVINNHSSSLRPGGAQVSRPQLAALMMAWGYAFFFPHRRGYGNSPGIPVADAIPASLGSKDYDTQIIQRLDEECADVLAATAAMRATDDIDGDRLALSGSSRGGILSLLAAVEDDDLRCTANFCGGARQWADHPALRRKMLDAAAGLSVPIFLAQAENDLNPAATAELADELKRHNKTHECHIYPPWGASAAEGHLFEINGSQVWGPDVRRFFDQHMA
ncbi:MAG: prolyl oligopeptidase family serine peptidase [Rhodospirillaceae bacterium]|nr:prolyl oligopeptidase family serine peptidase [Rhodospirillaceae bacterium]MBT5515281.1 prolyl oligopeptidase family serine peptidase [Rhodospirillaceae bacterium]MBT6084480.1 prolyl oligopeptidase family serine peptidase [Rhodospirillaceae bacterium]MBT6885084.1 prolyl oligopeptidase family serine peptidase [Rhodospirillaceae bacterium]